MEWQDFVMGSADKFLDATIERDYKGPLELQKLALQAYGPYGQPYLEGRANPVQGTVGVQGSIPTSWLLVGGVIALIALAD